MNYKTKKINSTDIMNVVDANVTDSIAKRIEASAIANQKQINDSIVRGIEAVNRVLSSEMAQWICTKGILEASAIASQKQINDSIVRGMEAVNRVLSSEMAQWICTKGILEASAIASQKQINDSILKGMEAANRF